MPYCKICGDEKQAEYRDRARMNLCPSCYSDMPKTGHKATYSEFLALTFKTAGDATTREFYSDYLCSKIFDVAEYWDACGSAI